MTTPIPGYAENVSDDRLLGHIAWYTITQPHVTHEELAEMVSDLPLNKNLLPSKPRLGDAFKRACRYSERKGLSYKKDQFVNFLIRKVTQSTNEVIRHLVLEIVDSEGETLEYHDVAHLKFDRKANTLNVRKLNLNNELDALTQETLKLFTDNFDHASKYLDAQVLRLMIRHQLDGMGAISVRKQGSIYFAPLGVKDQTEALETLCERLGNGSMFHALPLIDTTKQREMVTAAFEEEVHDEATQIITELKAKKIQGSQVTGRAFDAYRVRYNQLKNNASEYAQLVENEMVKTKTEIKALDQHLMEMLTEGLVKS
jgi:uncharacterized protein (UPF0305 family)